MRITSSWAICGFLGVALLSGCAPTSVSTLKLATSDTADLLGLTRFPNPPFTCRQFSSYERKSTTPTDAEGWFANLDAGYHLRVEEREGRKEFVLMDAVGPGAIVRIWSANPTGVLRFYFDHSETPSWEVPMADLLGGKVEHLGEPLAGVRGRGWNLYFPIPYAQHCKVTGDEIVSEDGRNRVYYHINYRTYPPKTNVETFDATAFDELTTWLALWKQVLETCSTPDVTPPDKLTALPAGKTLSWEIPEAGPAAIYTLSARVEAPDRIRALRELVLKIEFDGNETVVCPLGDFFGAGPTVDSYKSLPMGIDGDLLWSQWVMPYQKNARIEICNHGTQSAQVGLSFVTGSYEWTPDSMHFNAGWKVARDVPTRPFSDWNYVTIDGRGVFVGAAFSIVNPNKIWWGEGDEKIYVDGESFPSHFGTGTEDYYGYAWCSPEVFHHAYHNQTRCDGPRNYGRTAVNRWHILDRIPFQESFCFDMEIWHWSDLSIPELSVVTYWYGRPGARGDYAELEAADLVVAPALPYVAERVPGAIEGEEMRVVAHTGIAQRQEIDGCSNDTHLWWREGQPGDRLVLEFATPEAGTYRVYARFVQAIDYGTVRLSVNDAPAEGPFDFFNNGVTQSAEMDLGEFELRAGVNRFTVEIVGRNEKSVPRFMFGLDYLKPIGVE